MHLALVAPLVSVIHDERTPLGGAQAVVADLAHGLLSAGHQVTVLAADGSLVRGAEIPELGIDADLLKPADFSHPKPRTDTVEQVAAFHRIRIWLEANASRIDVAHGHAFDAPSFLQLSNLPIPVVHTLHLPPLDDDVTEAAHAVQASATYVAVSQASAKQWRERGIQVRQSIYPGLDLERVPFQEAPGRYLLFAGRITPEKGPDQAIDVAEALDQPLILAGEIYDREYFDRAIAPRVRIDKEISRVIGRHTGASYIGPQSRSDLLELMSHARGVLMPSTWDEPFGLVGIEAQATGTPVVAYRRGGLVEVVQDGETGWLVTPDDRAEFQLRVRMLDRIQRRNSRQRIEEHFSMRRMVDSYCSLYDAIRERER